MYTSIKEGLLCQTSIICFCNWLLAPYFQQVSTLSWNPCTIEWCSTQSECHYFMVLAFKSLQARQELHRRCPQTTRMLLKRPSLRSIGLNLHLINNHSISADSRYLTDHTFLKFVTWGQLLKETDQVIFNQSKRSLYLGYTMTINPDSWLHRRLTGLPTRVSAGCRGHRQLNGASQVMETKDPQHSVCLTTK